MFFHSGGVSNRTSVQPAKDRVGLHRRRQRSYEARTVRQVMPPATADQSAAVFPLFRFPECFSFATSLSRAAPPANTTASRPPVPHICNTTVGLGQTCTNQNTKRAE